MSVTIILTSGSARFASSTVKNLRLAPTGLEDAMSVPFTEDGRMKDRVPETACRVDVACGHPRPASRGPIAGIPPAVAAAVARRPPTLLCKSASAIIIEPGQFFA